MDSSATEKILNFQKLVKLYEKNISELQKRKKQYKDTHKMKDLKIQTLEKENEELTAKLNSKSVFGSMEINFSQLLAVQKENSELKTHLSLLEVIIFTHFFISPNLPPNTSKLFNTVFNPLLP